jgi:excisionase family DNA binding protein
MKMQHSAQTAVLDTVQIVSTPGILGGKPRIDSTRISVQQVAAHYVIARWRVEEIAEAFDLTFGQIHAAISYYYDHHVEIDEAIQQEQEWIDQIKAEQDRIAPGGDFLDQVMTPPAVAREFNLSDRTVRDAIEQGKVRALKSGGTWLIRRAEAEARWGKRKTAGHH